MNFKCLDRCLAALVLSLIMFYPNLSASAEKSYQLTVDENSFDVKYDFDGDVIAMAVDKEAISLLIGTENVKDTQFQITLPKDLIRADNNAFAVLVNGNEVDYSITNGEETGLTFYVPEFTEEIEIIGTYVVPEFPIGVILALGSIFGIIIALQRFKKFQFR